MENRPVSCQHTLGSLPDQLVARGEHGSPAPETLNSPDSHAARWVRDGGLPAGGPRRGGVFQPPSLSPPAGGKRGVRGQTSLPFAKAASVFSSQLDPQVNLKSPKSSGKASWSSCLLPDPAHPLLHSHLMPFSSLSDLWCLSDQMSPRVVEDPGGLLAGSPPGRAGVCPALLWDRGS